jgi:L-cystine uptake protein TcyP (sodium:dicarboxylate symporter family)
MACSKCKKRQEMMELEKQLGRVDKWVISFIVIVLSLSIYGVFSLIFKLL